VTIDSATLMNKALEVIEARWLFGVPYDRIEVVVHRQSIIHSMVEFQDGSVKAQMGPPDMRFPIQCALMYPDRVENPSLPRFDPVRMGPLTFDELDSSQYPCFDLALKTARRGGTWPAALVGADEAAVALFLDGKINFTDISSVVEAALSRHRPLPEPTIDDIITASAEAFDEAWSVADPQPAAWSARGAMRLDTA
ncbi:MAG: 1-deoxy-D-xylulose-5-phosphate reductoisomerase, partial [Chloroflexota bacterium]